MRRLALLFSIPLFACGGVAPAPRPDAAKDAAPWVDAQTPWEGSTWDVGTLETTPDVADVVSETSGECLGADWPCDGGLCYSWVCCRGCHDGATCRPGNDDAFCGVGGQDCNACDPGKACVSGACL